jgi:hypothetical protein
MRWSSFEKRLPSDAGREGRLQAVPMIRRCTRTEEEAWPLMHPGDDPDSEDSPAVSLARSPLALHLGSACSL